MSQPPPPAGTPAPVSTPDPGDPPRPDAPPGDLAAIFAVTAARMGDRTALIAPAGRLSFAQVQRRAEAFAATCAARGMGPGDRVLLAMPVGLDLYVALAAAWRLGATVVFPEPAMGLAGLRHAIRVTRPRYFLAAGPYRWLRLMPALWRCRLCVPTGRDTGTVPAHRLRPQDTALISFTSGSTGAPKAIPRSHGFLLAQRDAVAPLLASDNDEIDLVAFPVFALINLAAGRCSVLPDWRMSRLDRVRPGALRQWIARHGCTRLLLPPALCQTLAQAGVPKGVHRVFTGGGPVKPALVARLQAGRPDLSVLSVYGSTEAEPIADLDWSDVTPADLAAMASGAGLLAGRPVASVALRIERDEIWVSGPHVNAGYLDPAMDTGTKVHEGGRVWHRTGDGGRLDADGRLWLLGRHRAIATGTAGRLYPFAVELAAETWPGVDRAALWVAAQEDTQRDPRRKGGHPPMAPVLVLEARKDPNHRDRARELGIDRVLWVDALPMDRRHRSKVDYQALSRMVARG